MICIKCVRAADDAIVKVLNEKTLEFDIVENKHCDDDGANCTCQHKPKDSRKGVREE